MPTHVAQIARRPVAPRGGLDVRALLRRWLEARRQRLALKRLDPRLLADIGLSPRAAQAEAARPFWDVAAR